MTFNKCSKLTFGFAYNGKIGGNNLTQVMSHWKMPVVNSINVPQYATTSIPSTGFTVSSDVTTLVTKLKVDIEFDSTKGTGKHWNVNLKRTDADYVKKKEANYEYALVWLKTTLDRHYLQTSSTTDLLVKKEQAFKDNTQSASLIDPNQYNLGTDPKKFEKTWSQIKQILTQGELKLIFSAFDYLCSQKITIQQNYGDLGLTEKQVADINENRAKIRIMKSTYGKATQTKDYVEKTTREQKIKDRQELENNINNNIMTLTRIVELNLNNMPPSVALAEYQKFKSDPSLTNKTNLVNKFNAWKKQLVADYTANVTGFNLDDHIVK